MYWQGTLKLVEGTFGVFLSRKRRSKSCPCSNLHVKILRELAESKLESMGVRGELSEHEVDTVFLDPDLSNDY